MLKRLLLSLFAAAALLAPAYGQVAVDTSKTQTGRSAVLLDASAVAVVLPSSGSSNASGQITMTTALPATPTGTIGLSLPAGVVTAGTQGTGAGVYQATCSSTTVCTLTGTVTTANAAYTQTTGEVVLATTTIPAGAMGLNGGLVVIPSVTVTNSVNNKTLRIRLGGIGGTVFASVAVTTVATFQEWRRIKNRNSASLQVAGTAAGAGNAIGSTASAITTGAVDTSTSQDLVITAQLAVATEFMILENREIWQLP